MTAVCIFCSRKSGSTLSFWIRKKNGTPKQPVKTSHPLCFFIAEKTCAVRLIGLTGWCTGPELHRPVPVPCMTAGRRSSSPCLTSCRGFVAAALTPVEERDARAVKRLLLCDVLLPSQLRKSRTDWCHVTALNRPAHGQGIHSWHGYSLRSFSLEYSTVTPVVFVPVIVAVV